MNTLKTARYCLAQIVATALIVFAVSLAVSGLLAQSPTPQSAPQAEAKKRGACKKWAEDLKKAKPKEVKLRKAFVTALKESAKKTAEGIETRKKLRDGSSDDAKKEILRIFYSDTKEPNFDPEFPDEAYFRFFEPDEPVTDDVNLAKEGNPRAQEHCLHIFYLPEVGPELTGSDEMIFGTYLRCCYQPWLN